VRILYVASAVEADGSTGGATHVAEVACGLRDLGHTLVVVARTEDPAYRRLACGVPLVRSPWRKELALMGLRQVGRVMSRFRPDVVVERYYNFAGAGVLLAHRRGIPVLLEVNAPMTDPAGSLKSRLDRVLLGALRRWAVRQAMWSSAIVTPLHTTVPPEVPSERIHELPWGANVERFDPKLRVENPQLVANTRRELGLAPEGPVAVFLGSFRHWHGARHFALAARRLIEEGSALSFLAIGGGPELPALEEEARGWSLPERRMVFAGSRPHEQIPQLLAVGDIGVAPFDVAAHAPLREYGFYWSPLKVFEYMASGLPVVTTNIEPLNEIVRDGREGLLYRSGDIEGLAAALRTLGRDSERRETMGRSARARVVERYSWRAHCEALDRILRGIAHAA
jgi:glycosyltransferase involved in cell wall biosynthesis